MLSVHRTRRGRWDRLALSAIVLALLANLLLPSQARAWKPTTHVFLGELALQDALDNGKVTIYQVNYRTGVVGAPVGEYAVDPDILAALQSNPAQYRAGILGPDAYPDIFTGQQVIHPSEDLTGTPQGSEAWLSYLWEQSTFAGNNTLPIKAFTAGYLTHAAGDMFGHTFINHFTGGEFAITPPAGPANAIKHVVLEGYLDKRMVTGHLGADAFDVSIGDGVDGFIYRSLVDARSDFYLGANLLRAGAPGTEFSIPRIYSTLRDQLTQDIAARRAAAANCGIFDFSCSAIILNLTADYEQAWRDDIDTGLRAWPQASHQVAVALFFNSQRHADVATAFAVLETYATNHLLSMSGVPDFVGLGISFLSSVIDFITPDFLLAPIQQLKEELLDTLLQEAIGMSKEELQAYLTNPELYFDSVMNTGAGENVTLQEMNTQYLMLTDTGYSDPDEKLDYTAVPAIFNTVTMSKLILLSQSEINRLLSDLGSNVRLQQPNVMLGFIPSLDGSLQWLNGMVMAQDSNVYCRLFLLQPGETPINCRPTAQADFYSKSGDTPLVVAAPGILANDFDPDGDSISAQAAGGLYQPQHGSVVVNADGSFTYTPSGTAQDDVFGYYVSDGTADSPVAWVAISVTAGNAPPVARIDGLFQTLQGEALTVPAPGVLGNDSDVDGDPLSAVLVTPPNKGTLTLETSGRFVYTPDPAETGFDNFYYQAADISETLSAVTEVGIEIVANPNVLVAITDTYVALKNTPLTVPAPGLLANDTSRDNVALAAADPPSSVILGGFVTLQPNGSFTFTPSPNFFGEGSFAYLATDGTVDSNVSTTKIIIRESNAAPVAVADTYVISAGTPITVPAPGVLGNDWDSDYHPEYAAFGLPASDPQHAILVSQPGAGTATLNDDGSFTYTPGGAFAGRDSFTYKISDGWGESGPVTVRIVDGTANQAPVAGNDLYQTARNTQLVQQAPGILANDSDGDGDPLELLPGRAPTGGIVKLNLDGSFVYSPTVGFAGVDTFTYSIADSLGITTSATVTVNVNIPYFLPLGKR